MIVSRGTLKKGSVLVAGNTWGKVRSMVDEYGNHLKEAGPSTPVKIAGWRDEIPSPGETVLEVESEGRARRVVQIRQEKEDAAIAEKAWSSIEAQREAEREIYLQNRQKLINRGVRYGSTLRRVQHKENRFRKDLLVNEKPFLRLILRTDVDGSLEAIQTVLDSYKSEEVDLQIVDADVGEPNIELVEIAKEFQAKIVCFNVPIPAKIQVDAAKNNVKVEQYNVIYRFVDDLKQELNEVYGPIEEYKLIGQGHVLKQFLITDPSKGKKLPVAGTNIDSGYFLLKNAIYRFYRKGQEEPIYEGPVESLKQDQDFVNEAKTNTEVGIALPTKDIRFKPDDIVEVYQTVMTPRQVNWKPPGF